MKREKEEREKKMLIIITKKGGMTRREVFGDDLSIEERRFIFRKIEERCFKHKII